MCVDLISREQNVLLTGTQKCNKKFTTFLSEQQNFELISYLLNLKTRETLVFFGRKREKCYDVVELKEQKTEKKKVFLLWHQHDSLCWESHSHKKDEQTKFHFHFHFLVCDAGKMINDIT